ncbi:MAG: hypothetical protein JXR83_22660 [Deltaproteobacteria bacterium]|nr:hypothetical protein [Deltaproteobacteria bacterium]
MKEIHRQRLEQVRRWALQMLRELREATLDLIDEFKRQTIYFKARAGVVAGFVVLVVLTPLLARAPGIANPINARVVVTAIPWGESLKTLVQVTNESSDEYKPLVVIVEGTETDLRTGKKRSGRWKYSKARLREGQTQTIEAKHLTDEQNVGPSLGFTPSVVEVRCADGVYRTPVTVRTAK